MSHVEERFRAKDPRPARLMKDEPVRDGDPGGGNPYSYPVRFKTAKELNDRYQSSRAKRGDGAAWASIIDQYERKPYKGDGGDVFSNFGQLRADVDQALGNYIDYATERPMWARIKTDAPDTESQAKLWNTHISTAFQKFCINKWKRRSWEIQAACKDMLLKSKGLLTWLDEEAVYPVAAPTESIWPDNEANQFADDWDYCFQQKRLTAVELFMKIDESEEGDEMVDGWNRQAVLEILREQTSMEDNSNLEQVFKDFAQNNMSCGITEHVIDLVIAYVREYSPDDDGMQVSQYVFCPRQTSNNDNEDGMPWLFEKPRAYKSMGQVFCLLADAPTFSYYNDVSFASQIYPSCKQYDIMMNRVLQAVEDNLRIFIACEDIESMKKLQAMQFKMFQALEPGMNLPTQQLNRPVRESMEVMRTVIVDKDSNSGQYKSQSQGRTGQKTATEAEFDLSESVRVSTSAMKMVNFFMTAGMEELYRRFISQDSASEYYENYKKFKKYLDERNVPASAWDMENITIESILNLGSGSRAAKIQGANIVLGALARPMASEGQKRATMDIIAAVYGAENIEEFMDTEQEMAIPEDTIIGFENVVGQVIGSSPDDFPVLQEHLHMRHIPRHIQQMNETLQAAAELFEAREQFGAHDEGVILQKIQDFVLGVDQLGGHVKAHMVIAGQGPTEAEKAQLQQFAQMLQQVNKQQDKIEAVVQERLQARMQDPQARQQQDAEFQHKQRMMDQEYVHKGRMQELDHIKAVEKGQQLQSQSAANSEQKLAYDRANKSLDLQTKSREAQIDIEKKQASNGS